MFCHENTVEVKYRYDNGACLELLAKKNTAVATVIYFLYASKFAIEIVPDMVPVTCCCYNGIQLIEKFTVL